MATKAHKFGIVTLTSGDVAGVSVNSFNQTVTAETDEVRGQDGKVIEKKAYSRLYSAVVSGIIQLSEGQTPIEPPKAGNKMQLGGKDWMIDSVNMPEEATAFCNITLNISRSDEMLITPYDTPVEGTSSQVPPPNNPPTGE